MLRKKISGENEIEIPVRGAQLPGPHLTSARAKSLARRATPELGLVYSDKWST